MSGIKQNVVVLSATQYNVTNRETGEIVTGTSVRYALTDNLTPCQEDSLKGYKLAKASLGFNDFGGFLEVPGVYECDLNFNVSADGTTKINASNFRFKKSLMAATAPEAVKPSPAPAESKK